MDARVRLLGSPAVRVASGWAPLIPTKPHALFAYLAYEGRRVRRAALAALMWPDASTVHARDDVRQALRRLRSGPCVALIASDRDAAWVTAASDVHEFRRAVAEQRWRDAIELHGGPLLEAFDLDDAEAFSAWLTAERAAVAQDWRLACHAALVAAVRLGHRDDALRLADALVRADPLDERATRDAMRAAAALGDLRGAAVRFETLERRLALDVGMAPEPATVALHDELRRRSRATDGVTELSRSRS